MKILNTLTLVISLAAPAAAQAQTADVLGTWNVTVSTQGNTIPSTVKLKKDADKIVGTIASDMGETGIEAEVKGKALTIWFTFQSPNGPIAIEMAGTVEGDSIKGSMAFGGQAGGEWVATRAKDANAKETPKEPAAAAAKADLSGTYNVTVELPNMTANPTVVLKQDGEKLTGEYVSAQYGKFPVAGTAKAADVVFSFAMNVEGNGLNVTYTGKVDKDGVIKGSVGYGDLMSGTFTATKNK